MKKIKHFGVTLLVMTCGIFTSVASTSDFASVAPPRVPPGRCICPDVYKPVCIIATGQQFSNACHASCAGYSPSDWVDCSAQ
jgi:hypothetical protein